MRSRPAFSLQAGVVLNSAALLAIPGCWLSTLLLHSSQSQALIVVLGAVWTAGICAAWYAGRIVLGRLQSMTVELTQAASSVGASAEQVSHSTHVQAKGVSEQAASLEKTSRAGERIAATAKATDERTAAAAERMHQVERTVRDMSAALEEMTGSMTRITGSGEKISRILRVIDEIAFQTNLLALNAAVEAARAGEAGLGFAVVADEVRKLARRSADAAKETAALIQESNGNCRTGAASLESLAAAVRGVSGHAGEAANIVDKIHRDSRRESEETGKISREMRELERVTQETSQTAEAGARASESLTAEAEILARIAGQLGDMVGSAG